MKFEIKHRLTGSVLFSLDTESLKLCIEAAVKSSADLGGADLRGADLRGADLRGADLRGADLRGAYIGGAYIGGAYLGDADLRGAEIRNGITITKAPIQISGMYWHVTIWDRHMQIGCEFHLHEEWRNFSDDDWLWMGSKKALYLKREQFPMLIALCDQHKPKAQDENK